jgi:hypothetical protein
MTPHLLLGEETLTNFVDRSPYRNLLLPSLRPLSCILGSRVVRSTARAFRRGIEPRRDAAIRKSSRLYHKKEGRSFMSTPKKVLSLEELAGQAMLELPDRELLHVHKGGSHHGGSTTTTTPVGCGSQNNSGSGSGGFFAPVNTQARSCGSRSGDFRLFFL